MFTHRKSSAGGRVSPPPVRSLQNSILLGFLILAVAFAPSAAQSTIDSVGSAVAQVEDTALGIQTSVDSLTSAASSAATQLSGANASIHTHLSSIDDANTAAASSLSSLSSAVATMSSGVTAANSALTDAATSTAALVSAVSTVSSAVATVNTATSDLAAQVTATHDDLAARLSAISAASAPVVNKSFVCYCQIPTTNPEVNLCGIVGLDNALYYDPNVLIPVPLPSYDLVNYLYGAAANLTGLTKVALHSGVVVLGKSGPALSLTTNVVSSVTIKFTSQNQKCSIYVPNGERTDYSALDFLASPFTAIVAVGEAYASVTKVA